MSRSPKIVVPSKDNLTANGQKYDQGKLQWNLIPWQAQTEVVEVLTFGAIKYGSENWRKVPDAKRRYTAALFRHTVAWLRGETIDTESSKHHLAHAICCLLFLLETEIETKSCQV